MGAPRLEQLEQVVHGCVGSELRDGAHAEGRDRNVGKYVNEDELLDQDQTNNGFPAEGKRSWVSGFSLGGGRGGGAGGGIYIGRIEWVLADLCLFCWSKQAWCELTAAES